MHFHNVTICFAENILPAFSSTCSAAWKICQYFTLKMSTFHTFQAFQMLTF